MDRPALIRLAGFLAEHSVQTVQLSIGGVERTLAARSTDLPHELEALVEHGGTLTAPALGLTLRYDPGAAAFSWQCQSPAITMELAKALASS